MKEWSRYANIQFELVVEEEARDEAHIRIDFNPSEGASSKVGTESYSVRRGRATMHLGTLDKSSVLADIDRASILHEFGHALGFLHEHQSPILSNQLNEDGVYSGFYTWK